MEFLQLIPWWVWIIAACIVVSVVSALAKTFKSVADLLNTVLLFLISVIKVIWAIIKAPFRFVAWIIRRRREAKGK